MSILWENGAQRGQMTCPGTHRWELELEIHLLLLCLAPGSEFSRLGREVSSDHKSKKAIICLDWAEWSGRRDLTGKAENPGVWMHLLKTQKSWINLHIQPATLSLHFVSLKRLVFLVLHHAL